jgi:hypothetical protein
MRGDVYFANKLHLNFKTYDWWKASTEDATSGRVVLSIEESNIH